MGGKPGRVSVYLVRCVESHMSHHGEDYYNEAKVIRNGRSSATVPQPVGSFLREAMKDLKPGAKDQTDQTTAVLAAAYREIKSRGGRRKQAARDDSAGDLFSACRPNAQKLQPVRAAAERFPKPLQRGPDSAFPPHTSPKPARDS